MKKRSRQLRSDREALKIKILPVKVFLAESSQTDFTHAAVILISSHAMDEEKLQRVPRHLVLHFADVTCPGGNAFTEEIAAQIKSFVDGLDEIATLYVCCDAGESRSAALAAVLSRYLGLDEWTIWDDPHYHPNPLVYRLGCKVFGIKVGGLALRYRIRRNEQALQNAIRSVRRKR